MKKCNFTILKQRKETCYNCKTSFVLSSYRRKPKNKRFCTSNCKKDFIDKNGPIKNRFEILDIRKK